MSSITLNSKKIKSKVQKISRVLGKPLILMLGNATDIEQLNLNSALFNYIFGYEFPNTIVVLDGDSVTVFSGKVKLEIFRKTNIVSTFVLNRDLSNLEECIVKIQEFKNACIVDRENIKGDFCEKILSRLVLGDCSLEISNMLLYKEDDEVDLCMLAGKVVNRALGSIHVSMRDEDLNVAKVEEILFTEINGIESGHLETSFDPLVTPNSINIGVRYKGYCAEVARTMFVDMSNYYAAQDYIIGLIKVGESSKAIYDKAKDYLEQNGIITETPFLYTTGLLVVEKSFEEDFVIKKGTVFVLKLAKNLIYFSNTFVLSDNVEFITMKDTAQDYIDNRPRFRDKSRDHELDLRRKEHQRELLDKLIAEQLEFYSKVQGIKEEPSSCKNLIAYTKESQVPRNGQIVVDEKNNAVVIPISDFSVPFHISTIKNVVLVDDSILKFNFNTEMKNLRIGGKAEINENLNKEEPEPLENDENKEEDEDSVGIDVSGTSKKESMATIIKSLNLPVGNARFVYDKIQDLKNRYNAVKDGEIVAQEQLKLKQKRFGLENLVYKADFKTTARKKKGCCLELHENGFRYSEDKIDILFNNIRYIFFQEGDIQNRTLLHINLHKPILVTNKKTQNIQFYREAGFLTTHNTQKRVDDHMDYILEKEEEDRQRLINQEFFDFIKKIESESSIRVIIPTKGFTGVPNKETTLIYYANECLISLYSQPFFILPLEEVEVVNFERVVYNVKTCDIIFILKDKSQLPIKLLSVDTESMREIKDYLDSNNIVYMSTVFNIHWKAVLKKIMEDPVSFYSNGGWAELMVEDKESESEPVESEGSSEATTSEDNITTSEGNESSEFDSESSDDESGSGDSEDEYTDDDSYEDESSGDKKKKVRR